MAEDEKKQKVKMTFLKYDRSMKFVKINTNMFTPQKLRISTPQKQRISTPQKQPNMARRGSF